MEISKHSKVTLIWVPGHRDIVGNCIADEPARASTEFAVFNILHITGYRYSDCLD